MSLRLERCPIPLSYRELWLPETVRDTQLPPFRGDAHVVTLTGAQKRTTADGVHFTGTATSNVVVAAAAGQNAQQAFAITIRFKLDAPFAAAALANLYLFQKLLAADDYIRVYLKAADGKLYWEQGNLAGGIQFTLTSTTVSWTAGAWYTITVSLTSTPTQRLLVNGAEQDTDAAAAVATPNGGNMIIGSSSAGGVDGVIGTISWVVIGVGTTAATTLTLAEKTDLSKGIPPPTAKVQYMFLMDEGRGVTIYDRGSAGGNGTLDTACTWAFGKVKQPVLSLDGINDCGVSSVGVNISEDCTWVWVGKIKSSYSGMSFPAKSLLNFWADNNNRLWLFWDTGISGLKYRAQGSGLPSQDIDFVYSPAIDDYLILIGTSKLVGGATKLFANGSLVGSASGVGAIVGAASAYIGMYQGIYYDISKPLFAALIEGVFTSKQALAYSRWLRDIMNLPFSI